MQEILKVAYNAVKKKKKVGKLEHIKEFLNLFCFHF